MKISIIAGAATVLLSIIVIGYMINTLVASNVACVPYEDTLRCNFSNLGFPILLGIIFIAGFALVDAFIIYIIIRGWFSLNRLKIRYAELINMKDIAEKDYYKKMIDEPTFKSLVQSYEKEILELEVKIRKMK